MPIEEVFEKIKEFLKQEDWKEQSCREIYIQGELTTNFWKGSETIHISLDFDTDEEILEEMKK